jgi:hypothetical protein
VETSRACLETDLKSIRKRKAIESRTTSFVENAQNKWGKRANLGGWFFNQLLLDMT